jgi:hypothetical protein
MNPQLPDPQIPSAVPRAETHRPDCRPDSRQPDVHPSEAHQPGELDQILLDDTLVPSSGFAASVMESIAAIEAQAAAQSAAPAPIPFPWKLALPSLAALVIACIGALHLIAQIRHTLATQPDLAQLNVTWLTSQPIAAQALSALAALAGAYLCLVLTRYLALGRLTR